MSKETKLAGSKIKKALLPPFSAGKPGPKMTKSQNPEGGQGSDSQMLNNQHQSQTFTGKKEEKKKEGEEGKIKKKQEEKSVQTL